MPASGLKTSKKSKQTPKSSIVKSPIAKQPPKSAAAQSQALPKTKAKVAHQSTSADDFLLNSDRVTVDEVQPAIGEVAARKPKSRKAPDSPRAVVYIGRLPHGFFEDQLKVSVRSLLSLLLYSLQLVSSSCFVFVVHLPHDSYFLHCTHAFSFYKGFLGQFGEVLHVKVEFTATSSTIIFVISIRLTVHIVSILILNSFLCRSPGTKKRANRSTTHLWSSSLKKLPASSLRQ
jgi:hypothetical protein